MHATATGVQVDLIALSLQPSEHSGCCDGGLTSRRNACTVWTLQGREGNALKSLVNDCLPQIPVRDFPFCERVQDLLVVQRPRVP